MHRVLDVASRAAVRWFDPGAVDPGHGPHRPDRDGDSVFLGRHWFDACARTWPASLGHRFVRIEGAGGAVGHALIGSGTRSRGVWLRSRVLALNESLDVAHDEPTIELNGLFGADAQTFGPLFEGLLEDLRRRRDWDELQVSGLVSSRAAIVREMAHRMGLRVRTVRTSPTFWVDLDRVRARTDGDYLASLSSNARQRLRRAERAVQREAGPLTMRSARTLGEAFEWSEALGQLSRSHWAARGASSCFAVSEFVGFQRALIEAGFEDGRAQVLRLDAGDATIGFLYLLAHDGRLYFMNSGIDYARWSRCSPGLLMHARAIRYALESGYRAYDFLAGSGRYKATLSTDRDRQDWLVLWRPTVGLLVEDALRRGRRAWLARSSRADVAPPPGDTASED